MIIIIRYITFINVQIIEGRFKDKSLHCYSNFRMMNETNLTINPPKFRLIVKPNLETYLWSYHPSLLAHIDPQVIYQQARPHCKERYKCMRGKWYQVRRISCVVTNDYIKVESKKTTLGWNEMPVIQRIRKEVETFTSQSYDYCLIHIYRDGTDNLCWHNDNEAMNPSTHVASLSFGARRKFRFRSVGQTRGWVAEYQLNSGDMVWMWAGCQEKFEHTVPEEKRVKDWRINLTFRQVRKVEE